MSGSQLPGHADLPYGPRYWNRVASGSWTPSLPVLIEEYVCSQVEELILAWSPPSRTRTLKTDLFEQAYRGPCWRFYENLGDVIGVDVSTEIARRAQRTATRLGVVAGDVTTQPFADDTFDLIVSHSTLDHLNESMVQAALSELCRVLRADGVLIITLDSRHNRLRHLLFNLKQRGLISDQSPYHTERFYSLADATALVEGSRLRVVEHTSICAWLPLLNSGVRLIERLPDSVRAPLEKLARRLLEAGGASPVRSGAATLIALKCTKSDPARGAT